MPYNIGYAILKAPEGKPYAVFIDIYTIFLN